MAINALPQIHHERLAFALDVDRESRVPLYEQLCLRFRQAIQQGRLDPAEPLAPEPELAAWLGVSRFTLRQALGQLVREGLLRRQRGRGTFVVEPRADTSVGRAGPCLSLAADVEIVQVGLSHPTAAVAATLGLDPTDFIVEIVQCRSAQGRVVAVERITLDSRLLPIAGLVELAGSELYELVERYGGVRVTGARETVRAASLDAETATWLGAEAGTPVLDVERHTCAGPRVVELRRTTCAAESGEIQLQLTRADLST